MEIEDEGINRYIWILKTTTYGLQSQRQLHMDPKHNDNYIWIPTTTTTTYGI